MKSWEGKSFRPTGFFPLASPYSSSSSEFRLLNHAPWSLGCFEPLYFWVRLALICSEAAASQRSRLGLLRMEKDDERTR